ncbi:DUF3883 domain-containing protein [Flagellimonas oceanensis]|uniref:DUF3883 domain-containing protein n=1 Tax=Flagellimonas oceanensis TaxID=2499163 RepID=UPI0013DEAA87|nr:DUF3883 domain-containing protein [Allomuricauda oceanensis]
MEENKVGKKGLGFRSILNWSKEIYIASYDLHLKFSQQHAENFLEGILEEQPEIKSILRRKTKKKIPISVLRCPYFENDFSKKKEKGYDTVIELTLKEDLYDDILEQIAVDIVPEILIFLNKLEEIEVQTPVEHFAISKVNLPNGQIRLSKTDFLDEDENAEWIWNILEDKGEINGLEETKNYELKIAYNPDEKVSFHKLFSHFRTEVDFPYPVIAHGSFELKSDRNHLTRDKNNFNIQLIEKLAKLLINCSLKLTEGNVSTYDALKLLIPDDYQYSSLNEEPWNFKDLIKEYINETAIFPTLQDDYISYQDRFKFYDIEIEQFIPIDYRQNFKALLKSTSDEIIIDYINEEFYDIRYSDQKFTKKLNKIIDDGGFTLDQRAHWIDILSANTTSFYQNEKPQLPNLLIGKDNQIIKTGKDEIILPPSGTVYDLPSELELQFIDKDFTELLKKQINGDIRDLSTRLRVFGVDEYSMAVVARKLITGSHKRIGKAKSENKKVISGMHKALFHIFSNMKEDFDKTNFFQNLPSPQLFTRKGELRSANTLYFGKEYDSGYLCENLLSSFNKDVFVGSSKINGIDDIYEEQQSLKIERYLKWIGVADMPRKLILESKNIPNKSAYINYIFDCLQYPYSLPEDHKIFESRSEINSTYGHDINVLWFEDFKEIVSNSEIEHLITWFLKDKDIYQSIVYNQEHDKAEFWFLFNQVRNYRYLEDSDIKSYILFYLKSQRFIPVENGLKVKPTECVDNSGNLSPLVHTPQINYNAEVFNYYNIQTDQVELLLNRLGVRDSFKDLPIEVMYGFLNEHHRCFDKDSSSSSVLYNSIIDATSNLPKNFNWDIEKRHSFLESGFVLCDVNGKNEFISVKEATYVLNPNHSQDLISKLNVAKIRQRVGNARIKELFGVEPMDYIEFVVNNPGFNEKLNEQFTQELEALKPLLFIYRFQKNLKSKQKEQELSSLKNLKVRLCEGSKVYFELNGKKHDLVLKQNEYVYEKKSHTYYVQVDNKIKFYDNLKHDFRFTETLSDIICGAIAVTENRKDFMLLIGQPKSKWREILLREFPDFYKIESQVLKNFKGVLSVKQVFWKGILKSCKIDIAEINLKDEKAIHNTFSEKIRWDNFFDIYRGINYNQLSSFANFELFKSLFSALNLDLKELNRHLNLNIDFSELYMERLTNIHKETLKKYKFKLFSQGYSETFTQDIDEFDSFDLLKIDLPDSLFVDLMGLYIKHIKEDFNITENDLSSEEYIDVENVYKSNLSKLKQLLKKENIYRSDLLLSMLYENEIKNKIYFSILKEVFEEYKARYLKEDHNRRTVKLSPDSQEIDVIDDEKLISEIEKSIDELNLKIEFYNPEKADSPKRGSRRKKPKQSTNNIVTSIPNSDIGFIGEKYAFEVLKKEYDEVYWKSENAIRAGQPEGTDGFGYDFECVINGETRLVEVKSSITGMNTFYISKNEMKVGHLQKDNYDILFINNLLSKNIKFNYLKNIFSYKQGDTFFENCGFLVEMNEFKISFK